MAGQSRSGARLGLGSQGDPVLLSRCDEVGRGALARPVLPTGGAGLQPGFLRSPQHPLTPNSRISSTSDVTRVFRLFLSRTSRGRPGSPGPLLRQLSPDHKAAPVPQAVLAGRFPAPRPASVPAFPAPPSQRLEVGPSSCALRTAMSRGPGPGPEPRLAAEPTEDETAAAGSSAGSAG